MSNISEKKNKNSDSRIRANNRYNEKAYDRINIAVHKGKKDFFAAHAATKGESLNAFANRALQETLERDQLSDKVDE